MYIKIIRPNVSEEIHECESVTVTPVPGEENTFVFFDVTPISGNAPHNFCIEKATSSVYLMSNTGQTIESYRWPKERKKERKDEQKNKSSVSTR